jgi:hypothetical protein
MCEITSDANEMQRFKMPQRQGALFPGSVGLDLLFLHAYNSV